MAETISSFKELRVYQMGFEVQPEIFHPSRGFSAEERYALTNQIRSVPRTVGANITETWQKRRYAAHFVSKLTDSDGEQGKPQHWLDTVMVCDYILAQNQKSAVKKWSRITPMLGTTIADP